ncbi:MAG: DNA polymerase III subunit chi [Pseudomonadota bacterium]
MTRVDFYFNADDKAEVARKLAAKAYQAGQCALLYTPDERLADALDASLWSAQPLAFIPHVRCGHPQAAQTPILIGASDEGLKAHDLLINLADERPPQFSRFERLIEVVSRDPADRERARERYRFYQERGYPLHNVDLDKKSRR